MGLAGKAVDDQDSLGTICTMRVDFGGRVDEVDASYIVIGDLTNDLISKGTRLLGLE
jgi:hypothetical protein